MSKFRIVFTVILCVIGSAIKAQVIKVDSLSNWKKSFKFGVNLNQASFSSNWQAGGVNSIGFNSLLNYKFSYKKDKVSWDNEIDLFFGLVNNAGQGYRKTADRIFIDTKYGKNLSEKWSLFLSANFLTQFAKGYTYKKDAVGIEQATFKSSFLAPAFITAAIGFEYKPVDYFKLRLSPAAPRLTIVKEIDRFASPENPTPYGVDSTETVRFEWLAAQILAEFDKDIAKNLNLKWRYMMFANYETFSMKTIDHRLDLTLTAKINNFVNVSFGGILLYDYDQDAGAQVSQVLNIGFLYTFQNYKDKTK